MKILFCSVRKRLKLAQKAELIWWRNYLKKKEKTEYLKWKKNYWNDFLDRITAFFCLKREIHNKN